MDKQPIGKTYAQIIKFGRMLSDHKAADNLSDEKPELIIQFVILADEQLLWTSIDDFFSIFPPIKRYKDDGSWDYKSTLEMKQSRLGTRFGKNDFKHLIMTTCYENKYLKNIGIYFMRSLSRVRKKTTGTSLIDEFFNN